MTEYGPRSRGWEHENVSQLDTLSWWITPQGTTENEPQPGIPFVSDRVINRIDDVVVENFKRRINAGEIIPTNPFSKLKSTYTCQPIRRFAKTYSSATAYVLRHIWDGKAVEGVPSLPVLSVSQSALDSSIASVINGAYAKVASNKTLLYATLIELASTKDLLCSAAKQLTRIGKSLKKFGDALYRSKTTLAKGSYKAAENAWMQVRMGWRPFVGEVDNIAKAFASHSAWYSRQKFISREAYSESNHDVYPQLFNIGACNWEVERRSDVHVDIKSGILATPKIGRWPDLYGLSKLPETIWEVMPLSWAVDYFFNIGDTIAAWHGDVFWKPRDAYLTVVKRSTQETKLNFHHSLIPSRYGMLANGWKMTEVEEITRTRIEQPVGPALSPSLSFAKYTDLAIIARQFTTIGFKAASRALRK